MIITKKCKILLVFFTVAFFKNSSPLFLSTFEGWKYPWLGKEEKSFIVHEEKAHIYSFFVGSYKSHPKKEFIVR